jgi:hypothetical protein
VSKRHPFLIFGGSKVTKRASGESIRKRHQEKTERVGNAASHPQSDQRPYVLAMWGEEMGDSVCVVDFCFDTVWHAPSGKEVFYGKWALFFG